MPHRRTYAFAQKMMSDGRNDYRRQISSAKANRKHALFGRLKFRGCFPCVMERCDYSPTIHVVRSRRKRRTEKTDGKDGRKMTDGITNGKTTYFFMAPWTDGMRDSSADGIYDVLTTNVT